MLNIVKIQNHKLLVAPQDINKIAALKNKIEIPMQHVLGASIDTGILNDSKGLRAPGTSLPGYWAGSFKKDGEESFFNIKRENKPVVIQLKNEKYTRLVLGVDKPEDIVDLINNNIN
ncbi:MAG: PH domain-containing protein [Liquorilactobacillus sp.]|uniref:PH domain-containing protein n=1 Tax=Liquorilactobacillus sp. TaxID=2767923 RepID=UPI0039E7DA8C